MGEQDKINPAWKNLLDLLPQEFHNQVIPELKNWDQGVQTKFQEIHDKYEDYKKFEPLVKNNIDPEYAWQAVVLADQFQEDPAKVIDQANEAWGLGYVTKEEAEKLGQSAGESTDVDDLFADNSKPDAIFEHPNFKALQKTLQEMQAEKEQERKTAEEQAEIEEFEAELDALETKVTGENKPFHRTFVTALMSQGLDGEEAVKQYHQILAGTISAEDVGQPDSKDAKDAPPVMGNEGSVGAGQSDGSVDFGKLSKTDFNDTVEQLLAKAAESGQ